MDSADIGTRSIEALHADLRDGRITAVGIAERAIENYDRHDAALGAYKTWDPDALRAQAQVADAAFAADLDFGALQGIPVSIKDLYGVAGYPTFAGTPRALPEKWEVEGPVVAALRRGLAPVSGKTHTVEFAFGGVGTNPHWPTPRNPWDADRHRAPGGSSAGAGVSLLTGTAKIAVGSDTAGSVRVPASLTGTVGIKTSMHRWSTAGIVPLSPSLDTAGILARTAADAAIGFAVIDPEVDEHPLAFLDRLRDCDVADFRVGICDWFFEDGAPGNAAAIRAVIDELTAKGVSAVSLSLPEVEAAHEIFTQGGLAAPEFAAFINGEMVDWKPTLDPNVAARFERMEAITAVDYLHRRQRLEELAIAAGARMAEVDAILAPTTAIPAPDVAALTEGKAYAKANMALLRNTAPANLLTLCAVSLPLALGEENMPVGLQIIAPYGEDERTLSIACAIEDAIGTAEQRYGLPPLTKGA
jgi:aspartyl-tRNA(Asn)/glutamyl-tRNA(Gln) amidotransferase subunit A